MAGAAAGAGAAAAIKRARSAGLDEEFLRGVREHVTPGTSALLVLSSDADPVAVGEVLRYSEAVLLQADLTPEARQLLEEIGVSAPDEDATQGPESER